MKRHVAKLRKLHDAMGEALDADDMKACLKAHGDMDGVISKMEAAVEDDDENPDAKGDNVQTGETVSRAGARTSDASAGSQKETGGRSGSANDPLPGYLGGKAASPAELGKFYRNRIYSRPFDHAPLATHLDASKVVEAITKAAKSK